MQGDGVFAVVVDESLQTYLEAGTGVGGRALQRPVIFIIRGGRRVL